MATTNLNIRTDKVIKDQAEQIFNELGLNMTTAIREHGIPFELKLEVPNETTEAAIEEGRKLMADPSAPRYSSMESLKSALEV